MSSEFTPTQKGALSYSRSQALTDDQKTQARVNAGAASATHVHGNITNDGKVGSTANLPLITGADGAIVVGSFGTAENTFCQGNDSRLSDARTPVAHSADLITSGRLTKDRQHAQTAYKDEANTWTQAQTFQSNSTTYLTLDGTAPYVVSANGNVLAAGVIRSGVAGFGLIRRGGSVMNVIGCPDDEVLRIGGGNQSYIDMYAGTTYLARFDGVTGAATFNGDIQARNFVGTEVYAQSNVWVNSNGNYMRINNTGFIQSNNRIDFLAANGVDFQSVRAGDATFNGNVGVSGKLQIRNNGSGFGPTLTNGNSQFYNSSTSGLIIAGAGSSTDLVITNRSGGDVLSVTAGTTNVVFGGAATFNGPIQISSTGTPITSVLSATATLDFPSLSTHESVDLTMTVTGAAVGDTVALGVPNGSTTGDVAFLGWVSAADTVTIRCVNAANNRDPASGVFRATVIKF